MSEITLQNWFFDERLKDIPFHMRGDEWTKIQNVEKGRPLCKRCGGTGNEMLSMYKRCSDCGGTGHSMPREILRTHEQPTERLKPVAPVVAIPCVKEILVEWLRSHGFDGLFFEGECACTVDDLAPCDSCFGDCVPGYCTPCNCGEGCAFHISRDKPTASVDEEPKP